MSVPNLSDLVERMVTLSQVLDQDLDELRTASLAFAKADNDYRRAKAEAYLQADGKTIPEREAQRDITTTEARIAQRIADANRNTAQEAVRSRRSQLSACQSVANAVKAEIDMARTGPPGVAS